MKMLLSIRKCVDNKSAHKAIDRGDCDVALFQEEKRGVTYFVTKQNPDIKIPDRVRALPDFRHVGSTESICGKKKYFAYIVYRTIDETYDAFHTHCL